MTDRTVPSASPPVSPAYRGVVLAMLLLVYTFNFLDRQILGILAGPIKAELGLTDGQLGALGGIAFALLYSTLAIPLALLADRTSRTWVITVSLAVWSGFTALCGMAGSFGYDAKHWDVSQAMAEAALLPAVREAGADTLIVADGTSCRHQIKDGAQRKALHVAEVLERALA